MAEQVLELLGTRGCHLCDEAEAMLKAAVRARPIAWRYVDIVGDEVLIRRYGERIPVLRGERGEIAWPFSLLDILRLAEVSGR